MLAWGRGVSQVSRSFVVGVANSANTWPEGETRPILPGPVPFSFAVNHRLPSGPLAMPEGKFVAPVGGAYCATARVETVTLPMLPGIAQALVQDSVNPIFPS